MGDLAVVAEAVETCLPSPWKPLAARPGRGFGGREVRRAAGLSPQLPPAVRTRRLWKRHYSERARPTLSPAPQHPEAQAPTLLFASRAIAGQFPHRTPPSPGGRDAVLLSPRNRKDAKTVVGRGLRGRRQGAGPRGRHCDAPGAELGIGQRDGGLGPERKERAMRGGERLSG